MKLLLRGVLALVLLASFTIRSFGQAPPSASARVPSPKRPPLGPREAKEVESFLDPLFAGEMAKWHIPGAVFVLVKGGQILFVKGYGYADLEKKSPVVPDITVFRVGSISKLFTATAVMQLAERGKLDLNRDVNAYLKLFQLDQSFPQPVTLANLLTHTGGFDDRAIGLAARTAADAVPLGPYLAVHLPPRVLPPGETYSYSSFGVALAGYIVESVSGESFGDYVDENILRPLEMRHTSFLLTRLPEGDLASGYVYEKGATRRVPFDYFNISPAVGLNATGTDIAHFMIAHLDDGQYGRARILEPATAQEMHRRHFSDDPRLPGRAYGFYERFTNGVRAIGHGGNIRGFGSLLILIPEARTGFFISANLDEPRFLDELFKDFFNRYYRPVEKRDPPAPPSDFLERAEQFTGRYRINPYSRRSFEKLATLYWQYRVTANPDRTLSVHYPRDFRPASRWVESGPLFFERLDDEGHAVFREDGKGRITELLMGSGVLEKLAWYEGAGFQVRLVKFLMLVFLSACVLWPGGTALRRLRKKPREPSRLASLAQWMAGSASALILVFLVVWLRAIRRTDLWEFTYGAPPVFRALLFIPPLVTGLTAGSAYFAVLAWKKHYWSKLGRLHYTLVAGCGLCFVWFLVYWNLLGFRY